MGHLEIPNTWQRESHERCVVDHLLQCLDRKSTRLNSSHLVISYAVFCLKKKKSCVLALAVEQARVEGGGWHASSVAAVMALDLDAVSWEVGPTESSALCALRCVPTDCRV